MDELRSKYEQAALLHDPLAELLPYRPDARGAEEVEKEGLGEGVERGEGGGECSATGVGSCASAAIAALAHPWLR